MKTRVRLFQLFVFVLIYIFVSGLSGFAAETSVSYDFPPIEWNFQGKPVPETYWAPWMPMGAQELLRFKVGFRFSSGSLGFKCPVRLTFKYDPAQAKSGQDFRIRVKAEPISASYNTWESAFGIQLPNKIQIGFFGISGLPDLLPWWDLPWDLWDLIAYAPKVGSLIASAEDNIGVNTASKEALPLGTTKSYHDERTLISVDPTTINSAYQGGKWAKYQNKMDLLKTDQALKVLERIPDKMFYVMLGSIQVAKNVSRPEAQTVLLGLTKNGLDKLFSLAKIACKADPYFFIDGKNLRVNVRCYITNGKGSGVYLLNFTAPGQEKEFTFRDITPFIGPSDKLVITVDDITYEGKVWQGLTAQMGISLATLDLDTVEKLAAVVQAQRNYNESDFKAEIPVSISNEIIQGRRANPGCTSVSVNWTSPLMPLKGTVKAYDGNSLVKTVSESSFKSAHNVIVPGLAKGKTYRFTIDCVGQQGQSISGGEITASTRSSDCPTRVESTTCNTLTLSNPSAQAGIDYIDLSWTTNELASTEAMISPSPDISVNYVAAVKKQSGEVVQGWVTRGGPRQFVSSHNMRIPGLEPNTTYYYNIRSWTFEGNDETKNPKDKVGQVGQISTLPAPEPPKLRARVLFTGARPVPNIPVGAWKSGSSSPIALVTGADGYTPYIIVDKNATYTFKVSNQACYEDAVSPPTTVPASASGEFAFPIVNVEGKAPLGAHVYDGQGAPISGAAATVPGHSATTNAQGYYSFGPLRPVSSVTVSITKPGYIPKQIVGKVESCGLGRSFVIPDCILERGIATMNITVKNQSGAGIGNTIITVKEGSAVRGTPTATNSQGKFTWTYDFSENTQIHRLTVLAAPPASLNLQPAEATVSLTGGSQQDTELVCFPPPPADTQGPVISDVTFRQTSPTTINVYFKADEDISSACLEYETPAGQVKTTAWAVSTSLPRGQNGEYIIRYNESPVGVYQIKVKAKDKLNNEGASSFMNFTLFGGTLWNFNVSQSKAKPTAVSCRWTKYPHPEDFGHYVIGVGPTTKLITDINTITYAVPSLVVNNTYEISIYAKSKLGTGLTDPVKVSIKTTAPTSAQQQTTTGKEEEIEQKKEEEAAAKESAMKEKPEESKAEEGEKPAAEKASLRFIGRPQKAYVNKELSFKLNAQTVKIKNIAAVCSVDWGDGKKDEADTGVPFKHIYQEAGKYKISATASFKESEAFSLAQPATADITVSVMPPSVVLAKSISKTNLLDYTFKIEAGEGSYPIGKWKLSFGDGKSESGKGQVPKSIKHVYAGEGAYSVELIVADTKGTETKKSLSFKIVP